MVPHDTITLIIEALGEDFGMKLRGNDPPQDSDADDRRYIQLAIQEAERSVPEDERVHPKVGVVVVKDGQVLGKAHRQEGRHAEYQALERQLKNEALTGATVYTTLEPCTDRTEPKIACVDHLIGRHVARVVIGMLDPNPKIRGLGVRELEKVRIKVDRFPEDLRLQVEEQNRDFIRQHDAPPHRAKGYEHEKELEGETKAPFFYPDERDEQSDSQALRAFLQRAEVRLSTMHRVAGAFLSGAGLLFLLPVFFRDYPHEIVQAFAPELSASGWLGIVSTTLIFIMLIGVLSVPVYSLYLLVKDIVLFYFIGQCPGFSDDDFYPRFALTAIAFSPDESAKVKEEILQLQRQTDLMGFAIPRKIEVSELEKLGASLCSPTRPQRPGDTAMHEKFRLALGQAGLVDRGLVSEAARIEVSLVRHNVHLRRLVLRYAKALLLMIWTMIVLFSAILFNQIISHVPYLTPWKATIIVAIFGVWLVFTPKIVSIPIDWIYFRVNQNTSRRQHVVNDPELSDFEKKVRWICIIGWCIFVVAISAATAQLFMKPTS
jgi:pyrimidine deaminase RibD-like protein